MNAKWGLDKNVKRVNKNNEAVNNSIVGRIWKMVIYSELIKFIL